MLFVIELICMTVVSLKIAKATQKIFRFHEVSFVLLAGLFNLIFFLAIEFIRNFY